MAAGGRVCVGVIAAAHGVAGLVRVKSFTAAPDAVAAYGPLEDAKGRTVRLELVGVAKGMVIARIAGVADRDAAERLRGEMLYLPRAALPPPEDEEYYHADLIGLAVELGDGRAFGRVAAIHAYGAGDSIEVARDGAPPVLVPFTRAAVPVVDIPGGRLVIDPPDGLLASPDREESGEP
jgi:16S rRNA processing protein RimM